jgi:hypothetical protein
MWTVGHVRRKPVEQAYDDRIEYPKMLLQSQSAHTVLPLQTGEVVVIAGAK